MKYVTASFIGILLLAPGLSPSQPVNAAQTGKRQTGTRLKSFESNGARGIAVMEAGSASAQQSSPVQLEFYAPSGQIQEKSSGYETVQASTGKLLGAADIAGPGGSRFGFRDEWYIHGST